MAFSEQLSKLRKEANLTQEDLAEKCDVSRQAVAKWEKAESLPDIYTVARLAKLFNVSIEQLIWSKEQVMVENSEYFVRRLEKSDRDAFCNILRQHRIFGTFYATFQENNMGNRFDEIVWEQFKEALIFVVCSWKSKEVVGYFDIEGEHTSGTQITFKFDKDKITDTNAVLLTRDMCNWIGREYNKTALFIYVNSDFEKSIFNSIGYENIDDGVLVTLPL